MRIVVEKIIYPSCFILSLFFNNSVRSQDTDTTKKVKAHKNVIRYNVSGAMLFGIDKCVIFGYERVIRPHQTMSVNFGTIALPKALDIDTDSFHLAKESKSEGVNASVDYRFYLPAENKFLPPHGLYIGPYYSYNRLTRENRFDYTGSGTGTNVNTHSTFTINTVGFELGYQFLLWKRVTIDFLMVGPGLGFYDYKATMDDNIDPEKKKQIIEALDQMLTQKYPGLNYVLSDKEISGDGTLTTSTIGYRFLMQVGFNF
jgi:hypothetical protein